MIGPGEVMVALIVIGLPVITIFYGFHRFFKFREKQLSAEAGLAAEKAAQYAARTHELEQRVRVLEQIVTDSGAQTASQIEALREHDRIGSGEISQ
jgi:ribosomal protein S11